MPEQNDTDISILCPHCSDKLKIDLALSGQVVDCPHCAKQLTVPAPPQQAPAPPQQAPAPPQQAPAPPQQAPAPPQQAPAPPQQPPAQPQYQQAPAPPQQPPAQPQYQQAPAPPQYQQAPQDFHQQNPYFPPPSSSPTGGISTALTNPLEGQPQAIAEMGPGATLRWGWILGGIWIIAAWLTLWQIGSTLLTDLPASIDYLGTSSTNLKLKPSDHITMMASAAIPFFCLMLVLLLLRALGNRRGHFGSIVFTSGMAMLPFCLFSLWLMVCFGLIEIDTVGGAKVMGHILIFVSIFFLTSWILLIKASLVSVLGFAPKMALWLVPLVLVGWAYLSMWIGSLWGEITN